MPSSDRVAVAPATDTRRLWRDDFVRAARKGEDLSDAVLLKAREVEVKAVSGESDTVEIVISSGSEDRDRDVIDQDGLDFKQYKRNPVVLWCHEAWAPPIAQSVAISREGKYTVSRDKFATSIYPFAKLVLDMLVGKFLRAASIGGRPDEWNYDEKRGGLNIAKLDVWEHSICPIGANPDCLARAKAAGLDVAPLESWALDLLAGVRGDGLWLEKDQAEVLLKSLGYGRGLKLFEVPAAKLAEELAAGQAPAVVDPVLPAEPAESTAEASPSTEEPPIEAVADDSATPPAADSEQEQAPAAAAEPAPTPAPADIAAAVRDVVREELIRFLPAAAAPPATAAAPLPPIPEAELVDVVRDAFKAQIADRFLAQFGVLLD